MICYHTIISILFCDLTGDYDNSMKSFMIWMGIFFIIYNLYSCFILYYKFSHICLLFLVLCKSATFMFWILMSQVGFGMKNNNENVYFLSGSKNHPVFCPEVIECILLLTNTEVESLVYCFFFVNTFTTSCISDEF